MPGKRVQFDDETWHALNLLAKDRMQDFQELADEAFRDLLQKHGRPTVAQAPAARQRFTSCLPSEPKTEGAGQAVVPTLVRRGVVIVLRTIRMLAPQSFPLFFMLELSHLVREVVQHVPRVEDFQDFRRDGLARHCDARVGAIQGAARAVRP
jgi:hypothetical protein